MITIYVDGSCIGNHLHDRSKRKSYICLIAYKDDKKIMEILKPIGVKTNQSAEWEALIGAFKYCQDEVPGEKIKILSDCKNVVKIANGQSTPRAKHMIMYKETYEKVSAGLNVIVEWIPRNKNEAGRYIEDNIGDLR